jgi:glutathione synthase
MSAVKPYILGIVMDPIESINPKKDTTLAFMLEAQARGWKLAYMTMNDLHIVNGMAMADLQFVKVYNDTSHWYDIESSESMALSKLDVILMRKDPPFDMEYIMATYILERAELEGALVVNSPRSLRDVNEKVYTSWFASCCPPSLFTRSKQAIREFIVQHKKIVIKPTGKMGGRSVFVIAEGDPNTNVIIEEMTQNGTIYVQAQQYIPEISTGGDKRILLINGEPVGQAIARIPGAGDHRGNLAAGATAVAVELTARDRWICEQLKPTLISKGLYFVGIDIIGDYMTEINVTSPTGVREIDKFFHINVSAIFIDQLEILIKNRKH